MDLTTFLSAKPLYYDSIDLTRMPAAWKEVENRLRIGRVVHLVGTNGKGTTGRMLAKLLAKKGRTGHYSSPHVFRFNERIWLNGADAGDDVLEEAHRRLIGMLDPRTARKLSYFEYTTLLAMTVFEGLDFVVLEAGLGGEFDATAVVPKDFTVVTPIGYDHQAFLGDTVEAIAATKLEAMASKVLLAPQPYPQSVETAERIAARKGSRLYRVEDFLNDTKRQELEAWAKRREWPRYLRENLSTAAAAFKMVTEEEAATDILENFSMTGRFQKVRRNVTVDVGHNPLGAAALREAFTQRDRKVTLVYNTLADKDAETVLRTLRDVVEAVEILPIDTVRAMPRKELEKIVTRVGLPCRTFQGIEEDREYLVFGSFYVAEAFMKRLERG